MLETLATLLVLACILSALVQFVTSVGQIWQTAAGDSFVEAQEAFESITQHIALASLEPYQDYADATGAFRSNTGNAFVPDHLARRSDLDFVCGASGGSGGLLSTTGRTTAGMCIFCAAANGLTQTYSQSGMDRLFNALGYFVEFGADDHAPGFFKGPARLRWRLKQVVQPSETLQVFSTSTSSEWIGDLAGSAATPAILAENVIALVVLPERAATDNGAPLAPTFSYDSRDATNTATFQQLPPRVRVVLAAIDEPSALHLAARWGTSAPPLLPSSVFQNAGDLNSDLAALDAALTASKVGHRIYQREIAVATAGWSNNNP